MKKSLAIASALLIALAAVGCAKKEAPVAAPAEVAPYKIGRAHV